MENIIFTLLELAFDRITRAFKKWSGTNPEIPTMPSSFENSDVIHDKIIAGKVREMGKSRIGTAIKLFVYGNMTISFIRRVISWTNESQVEVGTHVLACIVSSLFVEYTPPAHCIKNIIKNIATYPTPIRYGVKCIVGRRESAFFKREQTDPGGVVTERCLASVGKYCVWDLHCKRTDFLVSLLSSLPMALLNAYMMVQTGQQGNWITLTFTCRIWPSISILLCFWSGYALYKSYNKRVELIMACEARTRRLGIV